MLTKYITDLKNEFSGYNASLLKNDVMSGVTVTAVALPLALAFGVGSGASASAGLITAIVAGLIIGALSGGSFQISGPTGAMTAILIGLTARHGLTGIWTACVISGVILIIAGILRFGKLVSFIPAPVMTGFTSGIALVIIIGQLDAFLGISTPAAHSSLIKLFNYFTHPAAPNLYALFLGVFTVVFMLIYPEKWDKFCPSSLAALIAASGAAVWLKLSVSVIGDIPKTLFPEARLTFAALNWENIESLFMPAVGIAALGMIETLLCGEVASKMRADAITSNENKKTQCVYDANRDLVAQGIGNVIIPFFGGVPATAAIARTSVGIKSGGKTRLAGIFHSFGLIISMFLLAPVMSKIPTTVLSGILIVTAWRMNEWRSINYIFSRKFKSSISKFLLTMLATVIFDLTQAIIIGVAFALILFIVKISNMDISVHEVDAERMPGDGGDAEYAHIRVAYVTGPLFFATVEQMRKQFENEVNGIASVLILSMRGVSLIDISGMRALDELYDKLAESGCRLMLCGLQPQVKEFLEKSHFIEKLGENSVFWSADRAIATAAEQM
jgi:SulP family sulfate permease